MSKPTKKVGLVFGGGGAKAFSHLGIADALRENKIPIDVIVACSGGSVMGALVANNVPSQKIKDSFYRRLRRSSWLVPGFSRKGLMSQRNFKKILNELCGDIDMNQCKIPFHAVTTNLNMCRLDVLNDGDLATAVCASTAFPGIYPPVKIGDHLFVDGGVLNSIPADVCRQQVGHDGVVISVTLDNVMNQKINRHNMFSTAYRSVYISLFYNRKHIMESNSDMILEVFNGTEFNFKSWREVMSYFSVRKMEKFYELGKQNAYANMKKIKELVFG